MLLLFQMKLIQSLTVKVLPPSSWNLMKFLSLSREFSRRTDKFQDLGFPLVSMTEFIGGKVLPNSSYEQECGFLTFHVGNDFHTDLAYILAQLLQKIF